MAVSTRTVVLSFVADAVLVVAFAAVGRASHGEDVAGAGLAQTAWPFLAGLALGWLVTLAWRRPTAPLAAGLGIWAVTVAGGMLLRAASGQGVAFAFVIVAGATLLVFLVGWRLLARAARAWRRRRATP